MSISGIDSESEYMLNTEITPTNFAKKQIKKTN